MWPSIGVLDGIFDWAPLVVPVLGSMIGVPLGSLIRAPDLGPPLGLLIGYPKPFGVTMDHFLL